MNHMKFNMFMPYFSTLIDVHTHINIPKTHWIVKLKAILHLRFELVVMELSGSKINNEPHIHI